MSPDNIVEGTSTGSLGCYNWTVWTASTAVSTIVIGDSTFATGPLINVDRDRAAGHRCHGGLLRRRRHHPAAPRQGGLRRRDLPQPGCSHGSFAAGDRPRRHERPRGRPPGRRDGLGQLKLNEAICVEVLLAVGRGPGPVPQQPDHGRPADRDRLGRRGRRSRGPRSKSRCVGATERRRPIPDWVHAFLLLPDPPAVHCGDRQGRHQQHQAHHAHRLRRGSGAAERLGLGGISDGGQLPVDRLATPSSASSRRSGSARSARWAFPRTRARHRPRPRSPSPTSSSPGASPAALRSPGRPSASTSRSGTRPAATARSRT